MANVICVFRVCFHTFCLSYNAIAKKTATCDKKSNKTEAAKGSLQKKKREIVCFFTKGGVPPPPKFGPISRFFLGKKGKSFRGLVFYGGGVPPPVW